MFEKIRRSLGIAPATSPEPQDAFQQLNAAAPLKSAQEGITAAGGKHSFICREAVLNRDERIGGYLFSMNRRLPSRMLEKSLLVQRVQDDAILSNLALQGVVSMLGHRHAFIYLSPASLKNPLLEKFAGMNVVVMISPHALIAADRLEMRENLQRLREMGIKYGWTLNQSHPDINEILFEADFIEVESTAFDGNQLKEMYREFRAISKQPKLIASGMQTSEEFKLCYHCGFDHFMGPFISSRENWHPAKSEINRLRVIQVLNMIRSGAEFDAIADSLRTESILTFKLLRYINSPAIGLQQKISEIPQALLVLGRDRFYRWLSLLLFDSNHPDYHERVLNEQVLARARFLEMLAGLGHVPAEADHLFMTGLFSLLDVMMDQPLTDVLKQVSLPESVAATLKGEAGPMRNALLLAIAIESGTTIEMATAAAQCGLDAKAVTDTMTEALAWAQQASAVGE